MPGILDRLLRKKAAPSEHENLISLWEARLLASNEAYAEWEAKFFPDLLIDYYKGFQSTDWDELEDLDHVPRIVNLFFPTVELLKPSLFFPGVRFTVTPRPSRLDDPMTQVEQRAQLQEDTLNTIISTPEFGFDEAVEMGLLESLFRFGIVETGYTADFIDNPNAGKPIMRSDIEDDVTSGGLGDEQAVDPSTGEPLVEPPRVPENERIFMSRIPAKNFRAPADSKPRTEDNEFFAYYAWHRIEQVRANKFFDKKAMEDLRPTATKASEVSYFSETNDRDETKSGRMVKIWKVWDLMTMHKITLAEGHNRVLRIEKFDKLPFSDLRFHKLPDSWYPIPEAFNWLPPQQELNETRAQQTEYRKRMIPKYIADRQMMGEDAIDALESRETGGIAIVDNFNPAGIIPLAIPSQNSQMLRADYQAKEDFREISGVTGEQRGIPDAKTATQAHILDLRARAREDFRRLIVGRHLSRIGRLVLTSIVDKVSLGFWVETNVDLLSDNAIPESSRVAGLWHHIKADDLGPMAFEVSVDVASLSPISQAQEKQSWNQVLLLISNPAILGMLGVSEQLMRKTLQIHGITNEKDIIEIFRVAQFAAQRLQLPAKQVQEAGAGAEQDALGISQDQQLPGLGDIQGQLENQLGLQGGPNLEEPVQ